MLINISVKMKKLVIILCLLLLGSLVSSQGCSGNDCQDYDNEIAKAAISFAGCSCVTGDYLG